MSATSNRSVRLAVTTRARCTLVEITARVREVIRRQEVSEGFVVIYVPHTTAGVCINENADPDVKADLIQKLEQMIPKSEPYYRHAEGNSDSHLKTILTGSSVTVIVENGAPVLGQWQGIYLAEFDGPRERQVIVRCVDLTRPSLS